MAGSGSRHGCVLRRRLASAWSAAAVLGAQRDSAITVPLSSSRRLQPIKAHARGWVGEKRPGGAG